MRAAWRCPIICPQFTIFCSHFAIFARSSRSLPAVRDLCPQFAIFARSWRFFARSSRSLPAVRDLCPQFAIFARSWRFFARICENKMCGVLLHTKTSSKLSTIARLHPLLHPGPDTCIPSSPRMCLHHHPASRPGQRRLRRLCRLPRRLPASDVCCRFPLSPRCYACAKHRKKVALPRRLPRRLAVAVAPAKRQLADSKLANQASYGGRPIPCSSRL
jgi:hypothetical protein